MQDDYELSIARNLSQTQREILVTHAVGPQPFSTDDTRKSREVLLEEGLLCFGAGSHTTRRPSLLRLTNPLGRKVCCCALGDMADELVKQGAMHAETRIGLDIILERVWHNDIKTKKWHDDVGDEQGKRIIKLRTASDAMMTLLKAELRT